MVGPVEQITHERDFKVLCDGLLRFVIGPLVQTYGASGADKGIDAEYRGEFAGAKGRWVFQYKFLSRFESPTRNRARLKALFCPNAGTSGEFDREGVAGSAGYVLLTNVPTSVSLAHALHDRWGRIKPRNRPFVIWDSSQLNGLLKGREYLARSWSGLPEARCRERLALPLWNWVERAVHRLADPEGNPLWPLVITESTRRVRRDDFSNPYETRQERGVSLDTRELGLVQTDPQYPFARRIAYPHAFGAMDEVDAALKSFVQLLERHLREVRETIMGRATQVRADVHEELLAVTAYAVLETRWGFPTQHSYGFNDGQFRVANYRIDCPDGVEPIVKALSREVPNGRPPEELVHARRRLSDAIITLRNRLWHVVELGIDADTGTE